MKLVFSFFFLCLTLSLSAQSVSDDYINVYQSTLSDLRNNSCPMYPSCSEFGREEFRTKPALLAAASTADRLLRCGHEHDLYEVSISNKGYGLLDLNDSTIDRTSNLYEPNKLFLAYNDLVIDSDNEKFIKKLINEQLHEYALYELLKLEYLDGRLSEEMFINRIICYEAIGEYEKAVFNRLVDYSGFNSSPLAYYIARVYNALDNSIYLQEIDVTEIKDDFYTPKITAIQLASSLKLQGLDSARSLALSYRDKGVDNSIIQQFITKTEDVKYKSRTLAGFLSIIPGLGYIYAGHKRSGIPSLIINSALAYTTIESFKKDNIGVGILSSLFSISFYVGNLSGSKKSADRFNEKIDREIIKSLEINF